MPAKKTAIHQEAELAARLPAALGEWIAAGVSWDLHDDALRFRLDGRQVRFRPHYRLHPARRELETLRREADAGAKAAGQPLLVTARLGRTLWEGCREVGLSCLDLNGALFLRAPGLWIERGPTTGPGERFRPGRPEVNVFAPRSVRVVRTLLSERDRSWRQRDLVARTALSAGLISQVLRQLARWGWVEGARTTPWTVTRPDALLDAWVREDRWARRVTLHQYATAERDLTRLARRLRDLRPNLPLAFTQWFAARLRCPYTEPPVVSAYLGTPAGTAWPEEELRELGLTPVAQGGRAWLLRPRDEGPFQNVRMVDDLPLVCDPQIYLDLLPVGLRGPEQAGALRAWEGFCRP